MCPSCICRRVLPPFGSQDRGAALVDAEKRWETQGTVQRSPLPRGWFCPLRFHAGAWDEASCLGCSPSCAASCWLNFLQLITPVCKMGMVTVSASRVVTGVKGADPEPGTE